ncbi:MAG: hypothetical protein HW421_2085 [Ignavibacteria bacterium]|nr:hypothetical protein [Ignavibacteria bacterium]
MKKTKKNIESMEDDLLPEYEIDYSKVKRNPYYRKNRTFIEIDEDVAKAFQTPDNINKVLKAIAKTIPKNAAAVL